MKTFIAMLIFAVCYFLNEGWNNSFKIAPGGDEVYTAYIHVEESL